MSAPPTPPAVVSPAQLPADAAAYVVEAPLLFHASLSNVLKRASGNGVPVTLVTTRNGLMQGNALLLSVAAQVSTTTYVTGFVGRTQGSVQVLSKGVWKSYVLDGAVLRPASPGALNSFNAWLDRYMRAHQPVSPVSVLQNWLWENRRIRTF
ncbi:hypothetical protein [Deinococcus petrolearius]|uniref:Uncharacterized protein n=1 Tax=Deinococcus petrolearius TaxID=1751295 RepID=A0ABW1DNV3_9DEIO